MAKKAAPAQVIQNAVGDGNIQIAGSYNTVIQNRVDSARGRSEKRRRGRFLAAGACLLIAVPLLAAGWALPGWKLPGLAAGAALLSAAAALALSGTVFVRAAFYRRAVAREYERYRRQNIHIELFARIRPDPFVDSAGDAQKLSRLARESRHPVVILGEPGSGKTESLRWLSAHFARRDWGRIPVRVELRDVVPLFPDDTSRILGLSPDWLEPGVETVLRMALGRVDELLAEQLTPLLKSGRLVVMVDALDELPYHSDVPAGLRRLMQAYPKNKYILTCRRHDFSRYQAVLGDDANLADLCPFSRENIAAFLQAQVGGQAGELLAALERLNLMDFASNPLTLWMLSILWLERLPGETLPRNRAAIIQAYVLALLRRNRKKAGTSHLYPWLDDAPFLRVLALAAAGLVERQRLDLTLEDVQAALRESGEEHDSQALVDQAIDAGLCRETARPALSAPAAYRFIHRQVLEYLAAERLLWEWSRSEPAFPIHLEQAWWEPHVLQAGLLDQPTRERLISAVLAKRPDRRATFLAIACAGIERGLSAACLAEIRAALKAVAQAGLLPEDEETLILLGKVGGPPAVEIVADLLDMPDADVQLGCVSILGKIGADAAAVPLIERALQSGSPAVARAAADVLARVCANVSRPVIDRLVEGFGWLRSWELAQEVASRARTPAVEEVLLLRLTDSRPLVAAGCAWVIGHWRRGDLAPALVPLAGHDHRLIRLAALHGLCLCGMKKYERPRKRLLDRLDLELYVPAEIDRYLLVFGECLDLPDRATMHSAVTAICNTEDARGILLVEKVVDSVSANHIAPVIRFASAVGTPEAIALLERLTRYPEKYLADMASGELQKRSAPELESRISDHYPRRGIVPAARKGQPDYMEKRDAQERIPGFVSQPDFLLRAIRPESFDHNLTCAALGLALLGSPAQLAAAHAQLQACQSGRKDPKLVRTLLALLEKLSQDARADGEQDRLDFARLLAACCPITFGGWGEKIDLLSKQSCVAAGAIYQKRYGRELLFDDLSGLIESQAEPAQVVAFAAFALAALAGTRATGAISAGLRAVDKRRQRVAEAAIGLKWEARTSVAIRACAEALEGLHDPAAVPALLEAVWRPETTGDTLLAVVEALQIIGEPAAIPTLARVARFETSTWGNPDEGGGSVHEIAGTAIRRLRRKMVSKMGNDVQAVYNLLVDSETRLEQRFEQFGGLGQGSRLAALLTRLSLRAASPRHRYYLAKSTGQHGDPRRSLAAWLRWETGASFRFLHEFWFLLFFGMLLGLPLMLAALSLPFLAWWQVFVMWIGAGMIGRWIGGVLGQWAGGVIGVIVTAACIVAWLNRKKPAGVPVADRFQANLQTTSAYDWILERLARAGIPLESTL